MSIDVIEAVWKLDLPPAEKLVLLYLAYRLNHQDPGRGCWPSITNIAAMTSQHRRTVLRILNCLEQAGLIARETKRGKVTTYRLNWWRNATSGNTSLVAQSHPTRGATPLALVAIRHPEPEEEPEGNRKRATRVRGTRLPDDFELSHERRKIAEAEHLDALRTFAKFRDHWRSASGGNARKCDWDAAWRNWCRRESDWKPNGKRAAHDDPPPARAPSPMFVPDPNTKPEGLHEILKRKGLM